MRKMGVAVLFILAMLLCLTGLAGCAKEPPEEDFNVTDDTKAEMTAEKFTEIMEQNGAFVTDMSSYFYSDDTKLLIATDTDTGVLEITDGGYSYIITFFCSSNTNAAEAEYQSMKDQYASEEKTYEQTFSESGREKYEFVSEKFGYNVIARISNTVVTAEGRVNDKDMIDGLLNTIGYYLTED